MRKAIGYIRVSTDKQEKSGLSFEAQEAKIRALCQLQDLELVEIVSDTESGKWLKRPGIRGILSRMGQFDALVITKLDRLSRSVRDIYDLIELCNKNNVQLVSASESLDTTTPSGMLVCGVLAVVAQWERMVISERTSEAMRAKKRNGGRVGSIPYGKAFVDGAFVDCPEEIAIIQRIRALASAGVGQVQIAQAINSMGCRTRKGTPWRKQYVARILAAA